MGVIIIIRAAIYSRKSKFTDKGESIGNQVDMCQEYLNRMYDNIKEIKIYEDEGFSGSNVKRPQFQKLMADIKKKKFTHLICYRLDRISRNVADFAGTLEILNKCNVSFISIKEQFDTSSAMGRAMMNIAAVFAQLERETIAERVRDNMLELAKTGRWLGGTPPLGFESEPIKYANSNGKGKKMFKLSNVSAEINLVKFIYKLYLSKKNFSSTASYLCKNEYKGKNGGEFSRGTVQQIILNPVYCTADERIFNWFKSKGAITCGIPDGKHGLMVYNKKAGGKKENSIDKWIVSVGKHESVVSSDIWVKCHDILEESKQKSSPRYGTGRKFLLSGMIICGECGSGMSSWSHYNKKKDFLERYYRCNLKNRASSRCKNKMLNAYKAEEYVEKYFLHLDISALLRIYKSDPSNKVNKYKCSKQILIFKKKIDANNKILKGLIRKFSLLDDNIDILQIIKKEMSDIKKENEDLENKITKLSTSTNSTVCSEKFLNSIKDQLLDFKKFFASMDIDSKKLLLNSLIKNIVWYGKDKILQINLIGCDNNIKKT
ncbi:recombinase family protein [Clostridium sp. 001]|uniref:recombinase family protein n=1 Tax=Clostridium sp. 001 TaxID=1970093 RepID=UPI001C2C157B|nr:recombinase family protein [Clostridium sp. 001]QXE18605.1 recombinase family protein [Clostridium sp. 001]